MPQGLESLGVEVFTVVTPLVSLLQTVKTGRIAVVTPHVLRPSENMVTDVMVLEPITIYERTTP